jgi:hypothetical protein
MEIISRKTTGRVYDAVIVGSGAAGGMAAYVRRTRGRTKRNIAGASRRGTRTITNTVLQTATPRTSTRVWMKILIRRPKASLSIGCAPALSADALWSGAESR